MFRANDTLFILRLRIQVLIDHSPLASGNSTSYNSQSIHFGFDEF